LRQPWMGEFVASEGCSRGDSVARFYMRGRLSRNSLRWPPRTFTSKTSSRPASTRADRPRSAVSPGDPPPRLDGPTIEGALEESVLGTGLRRFARGPIAIGDST
jgi:hypothetical protein